MSRQDLFKKQQELRAELKSRPLIHEAVSTEKVENLLNGNVDAARLASFDYVGDLVCPIEADPREAQALLTELQDSFNKERLEQLFAQTQQDLVQSIVGPFGLGRVLSAYDQVGGNVDTIHNAREEVYATDEASDAYAQRGKYNTDAVHSHTNYTDQNRRDSITRKTVGIEDGYSGNGLNAHDKTDLDHIISGKQTHDDPGRVLAELRTEELANNPDNLTSTHRSINRSKGKRSPDEFATYLEEKSISRKAKIEELNGKENLTDKERKVLDKLNQLDSVNPEDVRKKGQEAKEAQDKIINQEYYLSTKFAKNTISTGVTEGAKMGAQQALGVVLLEVFTSSFDEIRNAFKNGLEGDTLFEDIKIRLKRIAIRVSSKWKDVITGFGGGFISGFISNIVTTVINAFVTTGKRVVRLIREGLFSLLKALKTVLFPPEGTTYRQAAHESMKLVASGGIVLAGIALEEVVEKMIMSVPLLAPMASMITAVIIGSISTIGIALTSYLIDKLDLLGIIQIEQDQYIISTLDDNIQTKLKECERISEDMDLLFSDSVFAC